MSKLAGCVAVVVSCLAMCGLSGCAYRTTEGFTTLQNSAPNPPLHWKVKIGTQGNSWVKTPITVANGMVYVAAAEPASGRHPSGENHYLQGLDAAGGGFRWHSEVDGYAAEAPVVAGDTVYLASIPSYLYALDAVTGQVKWKFPGIGDVASPPVFRDGTVFLTCQGGGTPAAPVGRVVALDAQSGEARWEIPLRHKLKPYGTSAYTPLIAADTIYYVDGPELHAVNRETRQERWVFQGETAITSQPLLVDGIIYLGSYREGVPYLFALDADGGNERWRLSIDNGRITSIAVIGSRVYAGVDWFRGPEQCPSSYLYAVDGTTHQISWKVDMNCGSLGDPVMDDTTVYVATNDKIRAFDAATGKEKWRFRASNQLTAPVLASGALYVGDLGGYLYAIPVPGS